MNKKIDRLRLIRQNMILTKGVAIKPLKAVFYPTLRCNLKCKICFQRKQNKKIKELTLSEIKSIFDKIDLANILLVGGEIFCRNDIIEVLEYFNSKIKNVTIHTNGTLIGDYEIQKLLEMKNINEIWISVNTLKNNENERESLQSILDVIRKLNGPKKIMINIVMMSENIEQLIELYNIFNNEGVDSITYQFQMIYSKKQYRDTHIKLVQRGINNKMYDDCVEEKVLLENLDRFKSTMENLRENEKQSKIYFYPKIFEKNINLYLDGKFLVNKKIICRDIVDSVLKINVKGELILCEALQYSVGNLKEQNLEQVWNCDEIRKVRMNLCKDNLVDLCSRCCCIDYAIEEK
ncbi:MAG: radical SAM protein [Sarcina sp.]